LEGQSADLASKVRYWRHFGSQAGAKIRPWSDTFGHMDLKKVTTPNSGDRLGSDLGATCRRKRPKVHFEAILDQFCSHFGDISSNFGLILDRIAEEPNSKLAN